MIPAETDLALLERLSRVLHEMGLPCACQEEVERALAVFAEFETRRARKRLLDGARERARLLRGAVAYLDDLETEDPAGLGADELAGIADTFRVIAAAAAEASASLEMLARAASGTGPGADPPYPGADPP